MSTVVLFTAASSEEVRELPMSPLAFGLIAFALFLVALGVTWSFRGAAAKTPPGGMPPAEEVASGGDGGGHH